MAQLCARGLDQVIRRLRLLERGAQFRHGRLGCLKVSFVLGPPGQLGLDLLQAQLDHLDLVLNSPQPFLGPLLVGRPAIEPENVTQHTLTLSRRFDRELVGPSLTEKGRVDKSLIVEAEEMLNPGLRSPDTALGERVPAPIVLHLEVEQGAATLSGLAPAQDAIRLLPQLERKLDRHLVLAQMDQLVVPFGPRPTPQRPRDSVQQRRLACAVFASQTRDADAGKVQRRLAIAHKVRERKCARNHVSG